MQRVLLVCNAVLALFLAIRLAQTGSPAHAASGRTAAWSAASLRVEPVVVVTDHGRLVREVVLDFGIAVGPDEPPHEPVDLGVSLDAGPPVVCTWRNARSVLLSVPRPLPPASLLHVVCARPLQARDGQQLPAGIVLPFSTPTLRLLDVVVDEPAEREGAADAATLTLVFDFAVDRDVAAKCLCVRDPRDPEAVFAVAVELPEGQAEARVVTLHVRGDGPLPDRLELVGSARLVPARGREPLGRELVRAVELREELEIRGLEAAPDGIEVFTNRSVPLPVAGMVTVEPAVPFQLRRTPRGLRLAGEFAPGSVVTVEFAAGFPGSGKARLARPQRRAGLVPDREPSLEFGSGGVVLCASAAPRLPIRGCNTDQPLVRLRAVYDNNLLRALQSRDERALRPADAVPLPVVAPRNEVWTHELDLAQLAPAPRRGLHLLELWDRGSPWRRQQRWLQITDLGVTVRTGLGSAVVQVRDLVRGEPLDGADVQVLTPTNQVLVTGRTGADGLLHLLWPRGADDAVPYAVLARHGDDAAFVDLQLHGVALADPALGGRRFCGERPEAWVWPTRGIARPGETVDVAVLVRDAEGRGVPGAALEVLLRLPTGRVASRRVVSTPASGLLHASFPLPPDAPTGRHAVEVRWRDDGEGADGTALGHGSFLVEAFVPNRLEAAVVAMSPLRFAATGTVRVRGSWLDGSPASGRPVTARVRLLPHEFAVASRPGFVFSAGREAAPPGELPAVAGMLDERGEAELSFPLPPDAAQQTLLAHVAIELLDPSGRPVRAVCSAPVLRPDVHLGLRVAPSAAELCAVDADGNALPGELPAVVRLEQRHWQWRHERHGQGWRWRTEAGRTALGEWQVLLRDGRASVPLPPAGDDCFVVVTAGGRSAEAPLGRVSAAPDRLRVRAAAAVAPGATATLYVTAPAAGHGLVTIESDRVHAAQPVRLDRGDNEIAVAIPAWLQLPNVHAVVTFSRAVPASGPDQGPAWLIGGAPIRLLHGDRELPLTFSAPREILPETVWRGEVTAPGATTALLALVDEGVLSVTGHEDPDPLAFFLGQRALATTGADTGAALLERMAFEPGLRSGGDQGEGGLGGLLAGSIDTRLRPLCLFTAIPLDDQGRGVVALQLPVYEGRLRAMVVAAGPAAIAARSAATVVAAPLGLQVATPRMVAPGDSFTVPVTLHNRTGRDGLVVLECGAEGALHLASGPRFEAALPREGTVTIEVPLEALAKAASGPAASPAGDPSTVFAVVATLGGEQRRQRVPIHVRETALVAAESFGFDLQLGGELTVDAGWTEVEAFVRLDSAPDRQLLPVLERLLRYPYGCAEQTASQGHALLACRVLLSRLLDEKDPRRTEAVALVQAAVDRVLGMQTARGGFGWWSGASADDPFLSAHVLEFLLAARDQGFAVAERDLARGLDRLQQIASSDMDLSARCRAVVLLVAAGRPAQPWLDWLCSAATDIEDRLQLAIALGCLGLADRAAVLLGDDAELPPARQTAGRLSSPLRTQALRLLARQAIAAADPELEVLAHALQRAVLQDRHATTQENVFCLRALAAFYQARSAPGAAPRAEVELDGAPLVLPLDRGVPVAAGSVLRFRPGGQGFALVELRGRRRPEPTLLQHGLTIARTIVDADTGLPATTFRRGRIYEVRLRGTALLPVGNIVLVDLLPGGFEPEPPAPGLASVEPGVRTADCVERRDDRVLLFHSRTIAPGGFEFRHRVRAVFPGHWQQPPLSAEAMYDPDVRAVTSTGRVEIAP